MDGQIISVDQFKALTKLPSRDVLNGQLVGMLARRSPAWCAR